MGEIELPLDLELLLALARKDPVEQLLRILGRQRLVAVEALDAPAHAHGRRRVGGHVQVGRVARDHLLEQIVD